MKSNVEKAESSLQNNRVVEIRERESNVAMEKQRKVAFTIRLNRDAYKLIQGEYITVVIYL